MKYLSIVYLVWGWSTLFAQSFNHHPQEQLLQKARNAQMHYELSYAKGIYFRLSEDSSSAPTIRLNAIKGIRDIALLEEEYSIALNYHQRYKQELEAITPWHYEAQQTQLDKIEATCLQKAGDSQAALKLLSVYAFGDAKGYLDKSMVEYLAELLLTKYPKRALRKMLPKIQEQIQVDKKGEQVVFYLEFFEDKIYFSEDSSQYGSRILKGKAIPGQAVAHYQRKLCNSYFYQCLMQGL